MSEHDTRKAIFEEALGTALRHNGADHHTWKQSINQFSDMTEEEFSTSHGFNPRSPVSSSKAPLNSSKAPQLRIPDDFDLSSLPDSVDWREKNVISPVKDQVGLLYFFRQFPICDSYSRQLLNLAIILFSFYFRTYYFVKNELPQGGCGSCWAFGATEQVESHVMLDTKSTGLVLSPQNIVSCDTKYGSPFDSHTFNIN